MLLRVGVISIAVALALAAGTAIVVNLLAKDTAQTVQLSAETEQPPETTSSRDKEFDPGEKLKLDNGTKAKDEPKKDDQPKEEKGTTPEEAPEKQAPEQPPPAEKTGELPVQTQDWPEPSRQEVAAAQAPRYYAPTQDSELTLTVGALGLYDVPVIDSGAREALDRGVIHLPQTPMPWEQREQKNVYLAGHRLGYEGTGSRLVFYNLNKLKKGDSVALKDSSGDTYEYRVSEVFVVGPNADWAEDPVRGRDMVTLQTCTMPDFRNRIIVRADRV